MNEQDKEALRRKIENFEIKAYNSGQSDIEHAYGVGTASRECAEQASADLVTARDVLLVALIGMLEEKERSLAQALEAKDYEAKARQHETNRAHDEALRAVRYRHLLVEACRVIEALAEQQAMEDDWYKEDLEKFLQALRLRELPYEEPTKSEIEKFPKPGKMKG